MSGDAFMVVLGVCGLAYCVFAWHYSWRRLTAPGPKPFKQGNGGVDLVSVVLQPGERVVRVVDAQDAAPIAFVCTPTSSCLMRQKCAPTIAVIPAPLCGVPDSVLLDFAKWDQVSPTGKKIIQPKFCMWCGKPFTWQGRTWEKTGSPDEQSGEEWKQGAAP